MYTRREFGQLTLTGLALPLLGGLADSRVGGVRLGVQTYSFRALPRVEGSDHIDVVVAAMKECGLSECELFAPQVEPQPGGGGRRGGTPESRQKSRDDLRAWRLNTPIDHFRAVKEKFAAVGMTIRDCNYSFSAAMKLSKQFKVNLDIGHFTAADFDAVAYIREHHASITNLHLKDRRKHEGDNVPWGEGETPIREVLLMLKKERWPIPADI